MKLDKILYYMLLVACGHNATLSIIQENYLSLGGYIVAMLLTYQLLRLLNNPKCDE